MIAAGWVSQAYGCTDYSGEWRRPDCAGGYFHAGIDIAGELGTPILAPCDGVVVANQDPPHWIRLPSGESIYEPYLGPYAVWIRTDDGLFVGLGHNRRALVAPGERVAAGQPAAEMGSRGASTGPHVHVEVRKDGAFQGPPWDQVIDPADWLEVKLNMATLEAIDRRTGDLWNFAAGSEPDGSPLSVTRAQVLPRLDKIESRLGRLEQLLEQLLAPGDQVPADLVVVQLLRELREQLAGLTLRATSG